MITPIQNQAGTQGPESTGRCQPTAPSQTVASPFAKTLGKVKDQQVRDEIYNSVMECSAKYNLPSELILGVIKQESGFKPNATSHCGASGLMQLMPETAKDLGVKNRYDIQQNIEGGCKYLRQLSDRYDGNLDLTLAAYNAGPGNVDKFGGKIPPFEETQNYVVSIKSHIKEMGDVPDEKAAAYAVIDQLDLAGPDPIRMRTQSIEESTPLDFSLLRRRV